MRKTDVQEKRTRGNGRKANNIENKRNNEESKTEWSEKMWLLGFEPRSPRPQRGILTTKLQPLDT